MKAIRILLLAAVVISLSLFGVKNVYSAFPTPDRDNAYESDRILQYTVQILVIPDGGKYGERGMGTVFTSHGETLVLTHNHWHMLNASTTVQFRDAHNNLLVEINGKAFWGLVTHRDAGSLVLRAPAGLKMVPVSLDGLPVVQADDRLLVVHQDPQDPDRAVVMAAQVQSVDEQGIPVYKITAPNGDIIVKGDSGGGVWRSGQLVGNLWAYYEGGEQSEQVSIVARIPAQVRPAAAPAEQAVKMGGAVEP